MSLRLNFRSNGRTCRAWAVPQGCFIVFWEGKAGMLQSWP